MRTDCLTLQMTGYTQWTIAHLMLPLKAEKLSLLQCYETGSGTSCRSSLSDRLSGHPFSREGESGPGDFRWSRMAFLPSACLLSFSPCSLKFLNREKLIVVFLLYLTLSQGAYQVDGFGINFTPNLHPPEWCLELWWVDVRAKKFSLRLSWYDLSFDCYFLSHLQVFWKDFDQ